MIPLPVNPTVVIRQNANGEIVSVASNIAPDLKVVVACWPDAFEYESANKPFVDDLGQSIVQSEFVP